MVEETRGEGVKKFFFKVLEWEKRRKKKEKNSF